MRPHPRIRKTVKWIGLALTCLLVVAWVGSGFGGAGVTWGDGWTASVGRSSWSWWRNPGWFGSGGVHWSCRWAEEYRLEWGRFSFHYRYFVVPLWAPTVAFLLTTIVAWHLDAIARRRDTGKCAKCSYDRAGISAAAPCPECGEKAPTLTPPPPRSP